MALRAAAPLLLAALVVAGDGETPAPVTFTEHIAPIVFQSCTSCHRPGEPAPFPFQSYRDVRKRGRMIERVTKSGYMPPWHPEEGWGDFHDPKRLSKEQVETIARWVERGMPEGDPGKLPKMPEFPSGWQLGKPDLVVSMTEPFDVPAAGPDIYRNFVIPLNLDEDKWVTAVEVRPSARTVVHHVLFYLDDSGTARRLDAREKRPGFKGMGFRRTGSLGGWAVGGTPAHLPEGLARPLSTGSDLVLQTHFHPVGKAEREKTVVGLYFAKKPPARTFVVFQVPPVYGRFAGIDVPPGRADFRVTDSWTVPVDLDLVTIGAHAHYICQKIRATATTPDGSTQKLFSIRDWDFNWQGRYTFTKPLRLAKGTRIDVELIYDNSKGNPQNPFDPPQRIRWGLASTDEMGSVIIGAVPASEHDLPAYHEGVRSQFRRARSRRFIKQILAYDADGDGLIKEAELPERWRRYFKQLDSDGDGALDEKEVQEAARRLGGGR